MAAGDVSVAVTTNNGQKCGNWKAGTRLSMTSIDDSTIQAMSVWLLHRATAAGTTRTIISGNRQWIGINSSNNWQHTMGGSSVSIGSAASDYDTWINWVIAYDGANWNWYKNGVLVKSTATTNYSTLNVFGATSNGFVGMAKKLRMYNVQLTAAEIAQTAAGMEVTRGLKYSWDLEEDANGDFGSSPAWTNTGVQFANFDMTNEVVLRNARTGASDKFLISKGFKGQVYTAAISE